MKGFILAILVLFSADLEAKEGTNSSTTQLREMFHSAVLHPENIDSFTSFVADIKNPTPLELAYQAAAEALKAQEEWNPIEKVLYLKKFRRLISEAVELDSDEVEIRFLRFGIEYNIPDFLGSGADLYEDKNVIIDKVQEMDRFEIDQYFSIYILTLLADSGLCSDEEIALVREKIGP